MLLSIAKVCLILSITSVPSLHTQSPSYPFSHVISFDGKVSAELYWSLDVDNLDNVRFLIDLKSVGAPFQWVMFGFSDHGEYEESDLCFVDLMGDAVLIEDLSTDFYGNIRMDKQQDWWLGAETRLGGRGLELLELSRKVDTCDAEDIAVVKGSMQVVLILGNANVDSSADFKSISLKKIEPMRLHRRLRPTPQLPRDVVVIDSTVPNVEIPAQETTYWCHINKLPYMFSKKHIVQYEAIIQPGNEDLVHHMEIFHCESTGNQARDRSRLDFSGFCEDSPPDIKSCKRVLAAWAMGAEPMIYPEAAGLPVGGRDWSPYIRIEIHYNNPGIKKGVKDNSGIRFHVTDKLREFDAGILEVGLEYTDKMGIPPGQEGFPLVGYCIPECTLVGLPKAGINIFASQLHAHLTGHVLYTQHLVGPAGMEINPLNEDYHFVTHWQEIRPIEPYRIVKPGDALLTTCLYDTRRRNQATVGGNAITDEMCVNYIHYYPKMNLEVCKSSVDSTALRRFWEQLRSYENQDVSINASPTDNYKSIKWNQYFTNLLHKLYATSPISMQCNQSNGDRFPGYWEQMTKPQILYPIEEETSCRE